jgi:hypothetical protein
MESLNGSNEFWAAQFIHFMFSESKQTQSPIHPSTHPLLYHASEFDRGPFSAVAAVSSAALAIAPATLAAKGLSTDQTTGDNQPRSMME